MALNTVPSLNSIDAPAMKVAAQANTGGCHEEVIQNSFLPNWRGLCHVPFISNPRGSFPVPLSGGQDIHGSYRGAQKAGCLQDTLWGWPVYPDTFMNHVIAASRSLIQTAGGYTSLHRYSRAERNAPLEFVPFPSLSFSSALSCAFFLLIDRLQQLPTQRADRFKTFNFNIRFHAFRSFRRQQQWRERIRIWTKTVRGIPKVFRRVNQCRV